jgi:hypothetical protein
VGKDTDMTKVKVITWWILFVTPAAVSLSFQVKPDQAFEIGSRLNVPIENTVKFYTKFFKDVEKRAKGTYETTAEWKERIRKGFDEKKVLYFMRNKQAYGVFYDADTQMLSVYFRWTMRWGDTFRKGELLVASEWDSDWYGLDRLKARLRVDYNLKVRNMEKLEFMKFVDSRGAADQFLIRLKMPRDKAKALDDKVALVFAVDGLSYDETSTCSYREDVTGDYDTLQKIIAVRMLSLALIDAKSRTVLWHCKI